MSLPITPRSLHLFFFTTPPPPTIYTLSLHDALPIYPGDPDRGDGRRIRRPARHTRHRPRGTRRLRADRSEEHTSELQSRFDLVCRLLLEKKKKYRRNIK